MTNKIDLFYDLEKMRQERDALREELSQEQENHKKTLDALGMSEGRLAEYVRRAREIEIKPWGFVMTTDIKKAISLIRDLAAEKDKP